MPGTSLFIHLFDFQSRWLRHHFMFLLVTTMLRQLSFCLVNKGQKRSSWRPKTWWVKFLNYLNTIGLILHKEVKLLLIDSQLYVITWCLYVLLCSMENLLCTWQQKTGAMKLPSCSLPMALLWKPKQMCAFLIPSYPILVVFMIDWIWTYCF